MNPCMVIDGSTFFKRARLLLSALKEDKYPNAVSFASIAKCSTNTAQRTIYRLRDEFLVPIEYNSSKKGYYLLFKDFEFPDCLPPGKDELAALLFAREFLSATDADDLKNALDNLWEKSVEKNRTILRDVAPLGKVFSCDSTMISDIADKEVLRYVTAAQTGEKLKIQYKSPWRHTDPHRYEGQITHVHFSDGTLYLQFHENNGRNIILNSAFIKSFEILEQFSNPTKSADEVRAKNWLEGFGIWADEKIEQVVVRILPPASEYYASQRWHENQRDSWDGAVLVREFPSMLSPELVRRVLSLGRYLGGVEPEGLRGSLNDELFNLTQQLNSCKQI